MLYFFHHYELPVILQQAQLQQLLLRTHHGTGGMMGLAGIAALASGAAYHDAPGTGTQATPPTTQSTTQTAPNTVQSTTQTSPSVSTAQTNTTHTGDVISSRVSTTQTTATGTNTVNSNEAEERAVATAINDNIMHADKSLAPTVEKAINIREIKRKKSDDDVKMIRSGDSATINLDNESVTPGRAKTDYVNNSNLDRVSSILDRRRGPSAENEEGPPITSSALHRAPIATPEADDLD